MSQAISGNSVPPPPGGHRLHVETASVAPVQRLRIVEETSAGGLVINEARQVAVIARRNRAGRLEWCLPKGHLEGDETPAQAAVREISEETGILGVIRRHLGTIDYWFTGTDRRVHKVVHHYLLDAIGGTLTVDGDPDGEAVDVDWVGIDLLNDRLAYPNERRLADVAHAFIRDQS